MDKQTKEIGGYCEKCGNYNPKLKNTEGKWICGGCRYVGRDESRDDGFYNISPKRKKSRKRKTSSNSKYFKKW